MYLRSRRWTSSASAPCARAPATTCCRSCAVFHVFLGLPLTAKSFMHSFLSESRYNIPYVCSGEKKRESFCCSGHKRIREQGSIARGLPGHSFCTVIERLFATLIFFGFFSAPRSTMTHTQGEHFAESFEYFLKRAGSTDLIRKMWRTRRAFSITHNRTLR